MVVEAAGGKTTPLPNCAVQFLVEAGGAQESLLEW
jgi:hypothetical protein